MKHLILALFTISTAIGCANYFEPNSSVQIKSVGKALNETSSSTTTCGWECPDPEWISQCIPAGPEGPQGQVGPQGPQGTQGLQGLPGAAGTRGLQGERGLTGAQGAVGATGVQGPQDAQGVAGLPGAIGPRGPQGERGLVGLQGNTGATGPQGPIGLTGAQGAIGPAGPRGATGAAGLTPTPSCPRGMQEIRNSSGALVYCFEILPPPETNWVQCRMQCAERRAQLVSLNDLPLVCAANPTVFGTAIVSYWIGDETNSAPTGSRPTGAIFGNVDAITADIRHLIGSYNYCDFVNSYRNGQIPYFSRPPTEDGPLRIRSLHFNYRREMDVGGQPHTAQITQLRCMCGTEPKVL